ncbi:MAG: hypothetical protein SRB1_02347 [Desulfobacteraceae bacterium Eth-SRB1]|nr:MAG: hypothetical protein SRB1_02347 [Desulfobacteraceae bacterium Eth-SRB1]
MKYANKKDLMNVIDKSAEELHLKIDMQCHLMTAILEQDLGGGNIKELFLPSCYPKEARLKEAVKETVDVLEESRKAFKSKRLEALRKKLTHVLIESG